MKFSQNCDNFKKSIIFGNICLKNVHVPKIAINPSTTSTNSYRINKVQLNEDSTERQDTGQEHAWQRAQIPRLFGHLAWDLIGAHWMRVGLFPKAKVETQKDERQINATPYTKQGEHCGERDLNKYI